MKFVLLLILIFSFNLFAKEDKSVDLETKNLVTEYQMVRPHIAEKPAKASIYIFNRNIKKKYYENKKLRVKYYDTY